VLRHSILFLNRVYPPAEGATGQLLEELAVQLAQAGWAVTVVTGRADGAPKSDVISGVRVERVGGLSFTRASHWRRALSYLSLYPALLWRALRLPRAEVIVTMTDPPLQLVLGPLLKHGKGSTLVHWAQDVYPELAAELRVVSRDGIAARRLRALSTWALRRHDRVVAVGRCMKARFIARGVRADAIDVIPNWGHRGGEATGAVREENSFRSGHGLREKFVVMYSGNFGLAHPFEAMVDAAERLQSSSPQIVFVFVGNGPRLPWVREQVERRRLGNVRLLPRQSKEQLPQVLATADLHLASMRHELCGLVVPSKVYGALAAGRPCVFLGPEESEAAQFILQHGCGSVLAKATGARLASCLSQWADDPKRLEEARERIRAIAGRVSLDCAVDAFETTLELARAGTGQRIASPTLPFLGNPSPLGDGNKAA
jgi:glycosyltransferase involved in cell wall biosynthesis